MQLFFQENISGKAFELDPEESKHLIRVLRKSPGDLVRFTNGKGGLFICQIEELSIKKARLNVISQEQQPADRHYIHLAIAPTKNLDRIEWMLEKITEIGFHEISFISTEKTEKIYLKAERLEKKVVAACKQSLKTWKPKINGISEFESFIAEAKFDSSQKYIAHQDAEYPVHLKDLAQKQGFYLVLIGPEGDFSPAELNQAKGMNFSTCSLGTGRLRTETAGLVAVHTLNLINL